jgi:hypothetical protein
MAVGMTALLILTAVLTTGYANSMPAPFHQAAERACQPTLPNGSTPPGERPSANHHGNGSLWTVLWQEGTVVFRPGGSGFVLKDGSLQMKFPWWRRAEDRLVIEGQRLDAIAPPLQAHIPTGYGASGFQATSLIFPTPGCWEVTGRVDDTSLRFVVEVMKIGSGPLQNGLP